MRNKKFLFISTCANASGGSEQLWQQAAKRLAADGHQVSAFWTNLPHPQGNAVSKLTDAEVAVIRWKRGIRYWNWRFERREMRHLPIPSHIQRAIIRTDPDLVVFAQAGCFSAYREMSHCLASAVPYCCISQVNTESVWPTDKNFRTIANVFRGARRAFFVSQKNLNLFQMQIAEELSNAGIVLNPIPRNTKDVNWPEEDCLQIACVARVEFFQKGIDLLLQIISSGPWPRRKVAFNVYGAGQIELAKALSDYLKVNNVKFHGHVHDPAEIWKLNQVLVLPSRFEGMPLAILEAMRFSRPVVAADVAGHAKFVIENQTGFLAPHATVAGLADALERMWTQKQHLQRMGINAAKHLQQICPADPGYAFAGQIEKLA